MIHSSAPEAIKSVGSSNFWFGIVFDALSKVGVPLFAMISGALMLDNSREMSKKKIIRHIKKMAVFFACWSFVYWLVFDILISLFKNHEKFDFGEKISSLLKGPYHLWFVFLIIGFYLIVPLLRLWVNDRNKKYIVYFLILSFIFSFFLPMLKLIGSAFGSKYEWLYGWEDYWWSSSMMSYVLGYNGYFILGWYLHNYEIRNKRLIYGLGVTGVLISIFGSFLMSKISGKPCLLIDEGTPNIFFQAMALFVFTKSKYSHSHNETSKIAKVVNSVSKYSLNIYGAHVMIITFILRILVRQNCTNPMIIIFLKFSVAFVLSYCISVLIEKVLSLKKYLVGLLCKEKK